MKGFIIIVLCLFIFTLPLLAQDESVLAHYGTLKIGGILQTTFTYNMDEDDVQTEFAIKRSIFLFWGTILQDKIKYFVKAGGMTSPYIIETKLMFDDYIPMTSIAVGRYLPNFTHYMPRNAAMLDMINYPLIVTGKDQFDNSLGYAMWQQVGVQTTTKTDYGDFNIGVFNGYGSSTTRDNNDAKDFLLAVAGKPAEFLKLFGYGWFGNLLLADDEDLAINRYGGGAIVNYPLSEEMSVVFKGEYVMGTDEMGGGEGDLNSYGYYAHVGFKVKPQIELLIRYDNFDPNTDGDVDGDAVTWITLGANYFFDGEHVKFSLNYIMKKQEDTETVDDVDDDQVVAQVQLFF